MNLPEVTIPTLLTEAARSRPSATYCVYGDLRWSISEFTDQVARCAAQLVADGVRPGHRVAVMLNHHPGHAVVALALVSLRATWVAINTKLRGSALRHAFTHAEPSLLLIEPDMLAAVNECGAQWPETRVINTGQTCWNLPPHSFKMTASGPDDVVALIFTSGTSGPAKAVQVTDRMLRAAGTATLHAAAPQPGDVMLLWEPLFHIGGAQVLLLPLLTEVSIAYLKRLSVSRFWEDATAARATHVHHLGGLLAMLLDRPPDTAERQHLVRVMWGGGAPTDVWSKAEQRFGVKVVEAYGMTEVSSFATINDVGPEAGIGRPFSPLDVRVADANGAALGTRQRGEIRIRSRSQPLVTPGYFRDPEATAAARGPDGWWCTGDLGEWDEAGNLHFHGRANDSMRIHGENVSVWEIEHVAASHPEVAECAAIGVASPLGEQEALLIVEPRAGTTLNPAGLTAWCRNRAAPHHVPRYIKLVSGIPKTASQRISRGSLDTSLDDAYDARAPERTP